MSPVKKIQLFLLGLLALVFQGTALWAASHEGHQASTSQARQTPDFAPLPAAGQKVPIGKEGYLIYGFDSKPKLGTIIMKVAVYTPDGKKDTSLELLADSGMPAMRGAHETGDQPFKLSRKGEYLLPVNIVMPGEWEIRLTVKKEGKVIFRGSRRFDV